MLNQRTQARVVGRRRPVNARALRCTTKKNLRESYAVERIQNVLIYVFVCFNQYLRVL